MRTRSTGITRRVRAVGGVLATIVLIAAACGDDSGDPTGGGTGTAGTGSPIDGLTAVIGSVSIDGDTGYEELENCPLDPGGALLAQALSEIDSPDVIAAGIGALLSGVDRFAAGEPALIACDRFPDDSAVTSGIGIYAAAAPADVEQFVRTFAGTGEEVEVEVGFTVSGEAEGGTFHQVCTASDDDSYTPYCEVAWADDSVLIGLYVSGPDATTINIAAMEQGLASVLPDVIANLATAG